MCRYCLLIASMLILSGLAVAQQKEKPDKGVSKPRIDEDYWQKYPTEVPDLVGPKAEKKATMPGKQEINEKNSSVIKAAKRAVEAHVVALNIIEGRIKSGPFAGVILYMEKAEVFEEIYDLKKLTSDKPETLLPLAEDLLQIRAELEEFAVLSDRAGTQDRVTLPILRAARYKAEIEVLNLRSKIKK
jgi:hypothetical protein